MRTPFALSLVAILFALAAPSAAKADSFQTFNFNGTLANGSVAGTVTIDTTTGKVTAEDFTATVNKTQFKFDGTAYAQGDNIISPYDYTAEFSGTYGALFQLGFTTQSLIGYTGGNVCSLPGNCNFSTSSLGLDVMTTGQLTPLTNAAPTPEPSSLVLFGSGLLGVAGVARRKFFA